LRLERRVVPAVPGGKNRPRWPRPASSGADSPDLRSTLTNLTKQLPSSIAKIARSLA